MNAFLSRLTSSTWFLALLPAMIAIYFLPHPEIGNEYAVATSEYSRPYPQAYYIDLNGDGVSEHVDATGGRPLNNIHITDNQFNIHDQWNVPDTYVESISGIFFGDYDHDRLTELFIMTLSEDSLYLHVNEFFDTSGLRIERLFVEKIKLIRGAPDSRLFYAGMSDATGDGHDELYFSISSGFTLEPRLLYSLDLVSNTIKKSPYTSVNFTFPEMNDLDGDGHPEIICATTASGNHHVPTPFSDYSAWLMVFDDQLAFRFPPIEFKGFGNAITTRAADIGGELRLFVFQRYFGTDSVTVVPELRVYSTRGELKVQKRNIDLDLPRFFESHVIRHGGSDHVLVIGKSLIELDENLNVIRSVPVPFKTETYGRIVDINNDGNDEVILIAADDERVFIYGGDLTFYGESHPSLPKEEWQVSRYRDKSGDQKVLIKVAHSQGTFMELARNPYYLLDYLVYPSLYFLFFGFIVLIRRITSSQVEKREQAKRRLLLLQLQGIKGQLNPHFTFNALNSVAAMIYLEDRKSAYDHLNTFTRMLRQVLADAGRSYRTLQEEVDFLKAYLDLEKLRFGDSFEFSINVSPEVSREGLVPIMVLQSFAENAIKHGLLHKTGGGGLLHVNIDCLEDVLTITVEDNGVGRGRAAAINPRKGSGLKITAEFYEILNQLRKRPISFEIVDMSDETGIPSGTRVVVTIPLEQADEPTFSAKESGIPV